MYREIFFEIWSSIGDFLIFFNLSAIIGEQQQI